MWAHLRPRPRSRRARLVIFGAVVVGYAIATVLARRRGFGVGGNCIVRCRQGHLFTTLWIPGASVTSVRLGWFRLQWCPVGRHWSLVTPVRSSDLTEDERAHALASRDLRLP